MSDRERSRLAHHEAAHVVLGLDHGRRLAGVSLRPGRAHAAITQWEPDPPEVAALSAAITGRHPLADLPPDATRHALRRMVEVLAGRIAAEIAVPTLGRVPPPIDERIEAVSVSERLRLAEAAEPDEEHHDDEAVALRMAVALVGPFTAGPLLAWMRAEAREAVRHRWPLITAVASTLLAAETLDADGLEAITQPYTEESTP